MKNNLKAQTNSFLRKKAYLIESMDEVKIKFFFFHYFYKYRNSKEQYLLDKIMYFHIFQYLRMKYSERNQLVFHLKKIKVIHKAVHLFVE